MTDDAATPTPGLDTPGLDTPTTQAGQRLLARLRRAAEGPASQPFREGIAYATEMVVVEELPAIEAEARAARKRELQWAISGLISFALAAPTDDASKRARDRLVAEAKRIMGWDSAAEYARLTEGQGKP